MADRTDPAPARGDPTETERGGISRLHGALLATLAMGALGANLLVFGDAAGLFAGGEKRAEAHAPANPEARDDGGVQATRPEPPDPAPYPHTDKNGALLLDGRLTAQDTYELFRAVDFTIDAVEARNPSVPPVFVAQVPAKPKSIHDIDKRKAVFVKSLLPLVLQANAEIERERAQLSRLADRGPANWSAGERRWLSERADWYGLIDADEVDGHQPTADTVKRLLRRADIVPPALAIAQAAIESGWGTSRFAREGNALFGIWTYDQENAMVPRGRPAGETYGIRRFDTMLDSVRAYVRNLNTHRAYGAFRKERARLRTAGQPVTGHALIPTLHAYSERGRAYLDDLRVMIRANDLDRLDGAILDPKVLPDDAVERAEAVLDGRRVQIACTPGPAMAAEGGLETAALDRARPALC